MGERVVTALAITPVKGTRLHLVDSIALDPIGARGDRRLFVIDDSNRMLNAKQLAALQTVDAYWYEDDDWLTLELPDGDRVDGPAIGSEQQLAARFYSGTMPGRLVEGPFAAALSEHVGRRLRLVLAETAVDRPLVGAASLYSVASLQRLASEAGVASVDGRRFRMLIQVDGIEAHAEDRWVGRSVAVGEAVVHFEGHVGRCLVTTRDPATGTADLPTLEVLRRYRGNEGSTEPLPFGVYGRVVRPGTITVGDRVAPI